MAKVNLKIVQPHTIFIDTDFDQVIIPGVDGDFGVLEGHTPFVTQVRPGILTVINGEDSHEYAIHDGFVTVENDKITIICETVEESDQIDIKRAEKAKARAEERLKAQKGDINYRRAEYALKRAVARIELANKKN